MEVLRAYLDDGRPLLVMIDALVSLPNLEAVLADYGIVIGSDILLLQPDDPRAQILGQNNAIVTEFSSFSPTTKDFAANGSIALVIANARSVDEKTDNVKKMKTSLVAKNFRYHHCSGSGSFGKRS